MPEILRNVNLRPYNTFGIEALATFFAEVRSEADFRELLNTEAYRNSKHLVVGGGSNILLTSDFDGMVILNRMMGIEIVKDDPESVLIRAGAGENWHQFVMYTIDQGYGGIENLSLIPGCVGASPMQNIGAYGVEIKEVFHELEAMDMQSGETRKFSKEECSFGYRESVFKRQYKDRYLITSVTFSLKKHPQVNTSYGAISSELQSMGIQNPGIRDVSTAVIHIRQSKLPDPARTGNAGSFFKNPEVSAEKHAELLAAFPNLVAYPVNGGYKLAAGWLIEQCGLKGLEHKGAAVHDRQALVLVNRQGATGHAVLELSEKVIGSVRNKFGVELEREVNII